MTISEEKEALDFAELFPLQHTATEDDTGASRAMKQAWNKEMCIIIQRYWDWSIEVCFQPTPSIFYERRIL